MANLREELGLTPSQPASVEIEIIPDTELLQVSVTDYDPVLASDVGQISSITGEQRGGFDTKAMTHWRKVISPLEEKFITVLTRNSMKRFGYPADQL